MGKRQTMYPRILDRISKEHSAGNPLLAIADGLTAGGVPITRGR